MDALLDGKPHKCVYGNGVYANFEDMPKACGWVPTGMELFGGILGTLKKFLLMYAEEQAQWVRENNVKIGQGYVSQGCIQW